MNTNNSAMAATGVSANVVYLNVFFQSYLKSLSGYRLTQLHKQQAERDLAKNPSQYHYAYQGNQARIARGKLFAQWVERDRIKLLSEMAQNGYCFQSGYDLSEAQPLDFNRFEQLIKRVST